MSITIDGVPEYLTHEQYLSLFKTFGFDPGHLYEVRMAQDGVHVLVAALDEQGRRIIRPQGGVMKHRIFIPVRRTGDTRTTRVTAVTD